MSDLKKIVRKHVHVSCNQPNSTLQIIFKAAFTLVLL